MPDQIDQHSRHALRAFFVTPAIMVVIFFLASLAIDPHPISYPQEQITEILTMLAIKSSLFVLFTGLVMLVVVWPIYVLFRALKIEYASVTVVLAGAIAATLYAWPEFLPTSENSNFSFSTRDCDTIVDNVRTACGWQIFWKGLTIYTITGAVGGLAFWRLYAGRWVWKL